MLSNPFKPFVSPGEVIAVESWWAAVADTVVLKRSTGQEPSSGLLMTEVDAGILMAAESFHIRVHRCSRTADLSFEIMMFQRDGPSFLCSNFLGALLHRDVSWPLVRVTYIFWPISPISRETAPGGLPPEIAGGLHFASADV